MTLIQRGRHSIILCVCLMLGLVVGSVLVGPAIAKESFNNPNIDKAPKYSVNENGQSYGSAALATSPDQEPDLIAAVGVDGTEGYVLSTDLMGKEPKTPEEAVEISKVNASRGGRVIPLYDSDGKKVIGEFKISAGTSSEK